MLHLEISLSFSLPLSLCGVYNSKRSSTRLSLAAVRAEAKIEKSSCSRNGRTGPAF